MTEVVMPRLDPGMQSGKIVEWLKKEGDMVQKGEAILVVEGEKTTFEVEAPESGPLTKILADIGTDVQVAQAVAIIGEPGASPPPTPTVEAPKAESPHPAAPVQDSLLRMTESLLLLQHDA